MTFTVRRHFIAAFIAVFAATAAMAPARAQSTINTGQPAQNSNLSSLVIRTLAQAAASDINGIIGGHSASAIGSCPSSATVFEDCLVIGSPPYVWYKWTGSTGGWSTIGTINPTTGVFTVALTSANIIANNPITASFGGVAATLGFNYGYAGIFTAAQKINLNSSALPSAQVGSALQVGQADGVTSRIELDAFAAVPLYTCLREDGTAASPTALQSGDEICSLNAFGYDGTAIAGPQAAIRQYAAQNWVHGSALGTYLRLGVTANGSTTMADALGIENDGGIIVPPTVTGGSCGAGCGNFSALRINNVAVTAGGITALTGDGTASGPGSATFALASSIAGAKAFTTSVAVDGCSIGSDAFCVGGVSNFGAGLVGAPSIYFGSATTGFWSAGVGNIDVSIAGADSMRFCVRRQFHRDGGLRVWQHHRQSLCQF